MVFQEIPIQINDNDLRIFGVLRMPKNSKCLLILLPALTGTRLGPQNIYVEISRILAKNNIACLCLELPPAGDSYDFNDRKFHENYPNSNIDKYSFYLEIVMNYLNKNHSYEKVFIGSISVGCMPILEFTIANSFSGAILLSPNHFGRSNVVNVQNLKSYYQKLFKLHTWHKLFFLKINFRNLFRNITKKHTKVKPVISNSSYVQNDIKVLCIFGEKDPTLSDCIAFWKEYVYRQNIQSCKYEVIAGADHSFFGWYFKKSVCNIILDWVAVNSKEDV